LTILTSALLAILQDEPGRRTFSEAIEAAASGAMSVPTLVDVSIVIESRYGAEGQRELFEPVGMIGAPLGGGTQRSA
jgi:ribonuclease VapC